MKLISTPELTQVMSAADLNPAFARNNVAVFLASDDNFAPYLGVTLASIAAQADSGHNYDLLVLDDGLTSLNRAKLGEPLAGRTNISLRFVNLAEFLQELAPGALPTKAHLSRTTYGRLFAQSLFKAYERVIYLDCDLIVLSDLAELYGLDLDGRPLAGVRDYGMIVPQARRPSGYDAYCRTQLGLDDLADYINAGVLVMDLEAMRARDLEALFVRALNSLIGLQHADQDVINSVAQGQIKHLDPSWNVFEWLAGNPEAYEGWPLLDESVRVAARRAIERPKIVHYTGSGRPWLATEDYSKIDHYFWRYARLTPYYETLLIHSVPDYGLLKNILNYNKYLFRYYRYKVLAALTWGRLKARYQHKTAQLAPRLEKRRRFLR